MRIYFDFGRDKYFTKEDFEENSDSRKILNEISSFIETRLKLFEDEINKEPNGYIVVNIRTPQIRYYYSDNLKEKILESITEDDWAYIRTKIFYDLNRQ